MSDDFPTRTTGHGPTPHIDTAPLPLPAVIGRYRLLSVLGEGGMGTVYLAEQSRPVERRVALKVIKAGMDTREVAARFEAERQALAVMDHPGIARVFDAGATNTGRPYFVMELVEGEPITLFCNRHRLSIARRVELVAEVCRAVQHAHQKGVIHRDLKPSNVLVHTQDGRAAAKIIDFGIAKAIDEPLTDRTFITQAGSFVGTPAYMSPEQIGIRGLDIDTRSDIYSLGILLYELLVGALPRDPKQHATRLAILDACAGDDAPTPGARLLTIDEDRRRVIADERQTDPATLHRALKGDLSWIVMKAIEQDRARRYEAVSSFAADLQRYLDNEPVIARPPSASYRVRKFASRHRLAVAAAAALLILLVGSTAIIAMQATRVAAERDRAAREAAKATSINEFLQEMLASANPWGAAGGRTMTVVEALEASERRIDTDLGDQPDVASAVRRSIGNAYRGLGENDRAGTLLSAVVDAARADPRRRQELVEALVDLGTLYSNAGKLDEAARLHREAVTEAGADGDAGRPILALAQEGLAETLRLQGQFDEAERMALSATEIKTALHGPSSLEAADSYEVLATVTSEKGDSARAEAMTRQAIDIRRRIHGRPHPSIGVGLANLGAILIARGEYKEALPILEEALAVHRGTLGESHPNVATTNQLVANALMRLDRLDESAARLEEVLAVRRRMLGDDSAAVGRTSHNMGVVYTRLGNLEKADERLTEALSQLRRSLGADHPEIAGAIRNLGVLRERQGHLAAAEGLYRDALVRNLKQLGEKNPSTAVSAVLLGRLLTTQKRYAAADAEFTRAQAIREHALGPTAPLTREVIDQRVKLYEAWGQPGKAAALRNAPRLTAR
jgi:serine/threonine protein kinase/Tfp pilus assembly protein PilF